MQRSFIAFYRLLLLSYLVSFLAGHIQAQDLEPRVYNNAPLDLNFLLIGYQYSEGALIFDPSLPVTDASSDVNLGFIAYVHTLGIADKSAKVGFLLPYADLSARGYVDAIFRTRDTEGAADPGFLFTINFVGAPAMSLSEYKSYQQDTVIGFTLKMTAPLGKYNSDKIINIGTNRWSIKPEIGISKAVDNWSFEAALSATLFTENDEFNISQSRKQEPIYSVQGHIVYAFENRIWTAFSATYYEGGQTSIDGVDRNDELKNWRTGLTVAIPINRNNSIKIFGNSGVSTRTGTDYDSIGIAWQYRWGGGL